jgi:hypothetical protein
VREKLECGLLKSPRAEARSKTLQEFADRVAVPRGKKRQAATPGGEGEPNVQPRATFEIVLAKATNPESRMKMRFPESIADCINCARYDDMESNTRTKGSEAVLMRQAFT